MIISQVEMFSNIMNDFSFDSRLLRSVMLNTQIIAGLTLSLLFSNLKQSVDSLGSLRIL